MVSNKFLAVFVLLTGLIGSVSAQDRYAVYFKYKPQTTFSLTKPQEFLTQKAIDRRTREGIQADSTDLPVSKKYVDAVKVKADYLLYESKWLNAAVLVTTQAKANEIKALPFVAKVELVGIGYLDNPNLRLNNRTNAPKEPKKRKEEQVSSRDLQLNENTYDFQNQLIGIPEMHEEGFRGKGITIAVFDAGFPGANTASPLLHLQTNKQIVSTRDFVRPWNTDVYTDNQHGTNVLSLIASNEPGKMLSGAPDANYILVMTEEVATEYWVEEYNWVRGAEYSDSLGVDIISSSVGYWDFDDPTMNYTVADLNGEKTTITKGATFAAKKGILVVNSAGNYGAGVSSLVAPADAKGILAIGSVNKDLTVSGFSSRGPTGDGRIKPDLAAMGNGTALIRSNGTVGFSNGTSFSAPQISALAAGLWEGRPEWTKDQLILNLLRSGSQADKPDNLIGYGIPNFFDAYYGEILSVEGTPESISWKVYPNPIATEELSIHFGSGLTAEFTLIDKSGKIVQEVGLIRNSVKEPFRISLQSVRPGFYIVQMVDGQLIKRAKLFRQ
ncbi:MAG: S8 family serine peptidase [Algoriphagus sp.]|nr:S8 family serine peptidase [Algoriphagus sp.]